MSNRNISYPIVWSIHKFVRYMKNNFNRIDKKQWVNGRPVLMNGDVWCPMCERWHINNSHCQQ
jgi:hypothetical protein